MPVKTSIRLRRGTASDWTSTNPVLSAGEPGVESDTGAIKIGDGTTAWASLGYALSSRYKPLASDTIWLPAAAFSATEGSPALGTLGTSAIDVPLNVPAFLFDGSANEQVGIMTFAPPSWASYDLYLWWSNAGAGAGDVSWRIAVDLTVAAGSTMDTNSGFTTLVQSPLTAPAQFVPTRTKVNTTALAATANTPLRISVRRRGLADATDTLANDAGMLGMELVRVS